MRRKTFMAAISILLFVVSLVVGLQAVEVVKANWIPLPPKVPAPLPPTIVINSPENTVYHEKNVTFSFHTQVYLRDDEEFKVWDEATQTMHNGTLQAPQDKAGIPFIAYTIDGIETILRNITAPYIGSATSDYIGSDTFDYSLTLTELTEGKHTLTVNASGRQSAANLVTMGVSPDKDPIFVGEGTHYSLDSWGSSEITFIVDAAKPTVSIHLPLNKTYSSDSIQLAFAVDEPVTWTGYSLDDAPLVTCTEYANVRDLPDGSHSLVIYANDTAGNTGKSDTVFFSKATSTPSPSPSFTPTPSLFPTVTATQTLEPALTATPTQPINQGAPQNLDSITMVTAGSVVLAALAGITATLRKKQK